MKNVRTARAGEHPEDGLMLLAVVVMCALVLIALSVAAPVVARDLRRDKEVESAHRAEQYDRAIRLYYKKTKSYPPSLDALEKSNNVRFLRQKYIDPLTGKSDWRIIHVGQNQTQVSVFFGEPLAGIASTGLGSAAGLQSGVGSSPASTPGTAPSTIGSSSPLSSGFTGATIGGSSGSAMPGSTTPGSSTPGSSASDSTSPLSGGGGPIMGVGTSRTGDSILNPTQQTTYETWEFLYDPRIEQLYQMSNILGGGGLGSTSASSFGKDAVSGQSDSTSGSSSGTGGGTGSGGGGSSSPSTGLTH